MTDCGFVFSLLVIYCNILYIRGYGAPQGKCRGQELVQSTPNKALEGHVISDNMVVATPQLCRIQCYIEPRCVSSNFDQNSGSSANCQLSSSDAETHPHDLVDRPGTIYQGTKKKCHKVTCPPLMECHPGNEPQGYQCTYPHKCYKVPNKRVLNFPRKSVHDYIKVTTSFNTSLTAVTLSLMVQVEASYLQKISAPFSLATPTKMNSVVLFIKQDKVMFFILNKKKEVSVALNDGKWHHICVTWETTLGNWQVYIDGRIRHQGTGLAEGKVIGNGIAIIGQDQDHKMGGGFKQYQSFGEGRLTSMSLWDRVLTPHDGSFSFLTNFECHPKPGQVLGWEDMLKGELHGEVKVL